MDENLRSRMNDMIRSLRNEHHDLLTMDEQEFAEVTEDKVFADSSLTLAECDELIRMIHARVRDKYGILTELINDDSIHEIMVNGCSHIFAEDRSGIRRCDLAFENREELTELIRLIASEVHREINEMNPILDARLDNGSRVNAVYHNVALDGPILTIRKFARDKITMEEMVQGGTLTAECAEYLKLLIQCGFNIFISGGTSSGKTTFLNALTDYIDPSERVVVIEDSRERMMDHIENIVQMECHNANSLGKGRVSMAMLIRASLRMRPDRIIVGEVRDGSVADMLQGMNTGHSGLSTGHGNSVRGMLRRIESMYLMGVQIPMDSIRSQIIEGIDVLVHLARTDSGQRRVVEVQELTGFQDGVYVLNPLFVIDPQGDLVRTEQRLVRRERLLLKGRGNGYSI